MIDSEEPRSNTVNVSVEGDATGSLNVAGRDVNITYIYQSTPLRSHNKVFISSTVQHLPQHRKAVLEACMRMGKYPAFIEQHPASDNEAIRLSLDTLAGSELYLGIFAWRYGYIPEGHVISIAEMEYNHAVELGIPRLSFLMHEDHEIKGSDIEKGPGAIKLEALKEKLNQENLIDFFSSPEELRRRIIQRMAPFRASDPKTLHSRFASDVPIPPEPYIAHPYTLLQTGQLIGRDKELAQLSEWATESDSPVFNFVVAIGGMGKSALTWKWFNDIAPQMITPLVGRMWWSFYESDAHFENFVARALCYTTQRSLSDVEHIPPSEREAELLSILNSEPYLIVFDGFERIMIAYSRMDAARMSDDDLDEQTANILADERGLPQSAIQSFKDKHQLRKTADPRIGAFLRKIAQIKGSKILVSTRLYPAELQTVAGKPIPGSTAYFLQGLDDNDALSLWQAFDVSGSKDTLLPLFNTFDNYPLLIRSLAGEVANYRRAPGDFDEWQITHPEFNPFDLPIVQVKSHVLAFSLTGLDDQSLKVLHTVAAFRMPATFDTLVSLLVGDDKPFNTEDALDNALSNLEDRGLLGWDKRANRYDLHPIVRGVVWESLGSNEKKNVYTDLSKHFESLQPKYTVETLEDLTPTIELYNALIGLERFDEAWAIYSDHLRRPIYYQFGKYPLDLELLAGIPRDSEGIPKVSWPSMQTWTLLYESMCHERMGDPHSALTSAKLAVELNRRLNIKHELAYALVPYSMQNCDIGNIADAYQSIIEAVRIFDETRDANWRGISHRCLSRVLLICGDDERTKLEFQKTLEAYTPQDSFNHGRSISLFYHAQYHLFHGQPEEALKFANQALELASSGNYVREQIGSRWMIAASYLALADIPNQDSDKYLDLAESLLFDTLTQARQSSLIELESNILAEIARLHSIRGDIEKAQHEANQALRIASECGYRITQTDIENLNTRLELSSGHKEAAMESATKAYELAWCDGPPFAYYWGLAEARANLDKLGAPYPDLKPFDEVD